MLAGPIGKELGANMWDDAYRLEELRKHTGAIKKPASALIEVNRQIHEFVMSSKQSEEISGYANHEHCDKALTYFKQI